MAKPKRRQFSAEYRLRILEEADRCTQRGEVGRLLRREGQSTSILSVSDIREWEASIPFVAVDGMNGRAHLISADRLSSDWSPPPLGRLEPVLSLRSGASEAPAIVLAETIIELYKIELIRWRGPCRHLEAVELVTLVWVEWYNHRRLLELISAMTPAEKEEQDYPDQECAMVTELAPTTLQSSRGGSVNDPLGFGTPAPHGPTPRSW